MASPFPWLDFNKITQRKGQAPDEGGIDISEKAGTPITALTNGQVVGAGNYWGGGVVTVRSNVPGLGLADIYYQHINLANNGITPCSYGNCKGQKVAKGQILGHSQASPGVVEVGLNPPWYGIWGPQPHPSKWVDPESYLKKLVAQSGQSSNVSVAGFGTSDPCLACGPVGSAAYTQCHAALAAKVGSVPACAQAGIAANSPVSRPAVQDALTNWLNQNVVSYGEHIAIFLLAVLLIIIGLVLIGFAPAEKLATQAGKAVTLA